MDYRQLLKKYIKHVEAEEGFTYLRHQGGYDDSVVFTDEEWAKLQELEAEPIAVSAATHSCSCHVKQAGPCPICKELGCEVWNFNHFAIGPVCTCSNEGGYHTLFCPMNEKNRGD